MDAARGLDKGAPVRQITPPVAGLFEPSEAPNEPRADSTNVANHKQAEKRNRQRVKRRARNLQHLSSMRTFMKRVRKMLASKEVDEAKATLPKALTAIAKAASKGVIHRNTASRYVSRLTRAVGRATP